MNVAIPSLANDLLADANKVGWLPTIYLLSNVAFMLPVAKLADNFGRKRMYMAGLFLNAVAALMCAIAQSIDAILLWRFVQGMAAAMIFGTGIAIVTSVVPSQKRGSALGIVAACVYIGLTIAPVIGGYLTEVFTWRAVFYFQIPPVLILIVFMVVTIKGEWKNQERTRFDYVGTGLFALFTVCFVYGTSKLPSIFGGVSIAIGLTALFIFVVHQSKSSRPLLRVQMFSESRVFSFSLASSFFMYGSNFATIFLLSLYLQYIQGFSPAFAGKVLLLQALSMAIVAPIAGKLADKFEPRIVASVGCFIVAIGFIFLNQLNPHTDVWHVGMSLLLIGIGFGLFSTPNNSAIMGAVASKDVGIASASMNLSRTVGNLVGMSIVNLMLNYYLGEQVISEALSIELMQSISLALKMSLCFVVLAIFLSVMRGKQEC